MKKRKTGRRTRKCKVEKELEKFAECLRLILACNEGGHYESSRAV